MSVVLGSLLIGLILGFLGQRSRMCFIGGFRDFVMVKDKELLKGVISFFASAWLTICILNLVGILIPELNDVTNVKITSYPYFLDALISKFGMVSLISGLWLGIFSTLAGGCPLRQHVMAGQGRVESMTYLAGFYIGVVIYYLFIIRILSKFI